MDTKTAAKLALDLMEEFGLDKPGNLWTFKWDNATRRFGCCRLGKREISLSKPLTLLNSREEVEDTIRHEIAHALAPPRSNHDAAWKRMCLVTGARPVRCSGPIVKPPAPYEVVCASCGVLGHRYRLPANYRDMRWHHGCGSRITVERVA